MEIFRTLVSPPLSTKKINYSSKVMLLGSCFSDYMADKLVKSKFIVNNNPFGIVYNPLSVNFQLEKLMKGDEYTPDNLFLSDGVWCSYEHHSRFSNIDKEACLENMNQNLQRSRHFLESTDLLFLTFGTSYVYYLKDSNKVVSNCHKIAAREFDRKKVTVQEIVSIYDALIQKLIQFNPNAFVVFTVSPIRHWKDGAHENQLSKAILLLAIEELCGHHPNTIYFPSYEILMDDLRDYRFYAEDMLHPNSVAIQYIWEQVKYSFMLPETLLIMKDVDKIVQARNHRPFSSQTEAFQSFVRQFYEKIQYLKEHYKISFENEEKYFESFLVNK